MTKEEIVLETVEYYSQNPRSFDSNTDTCVYFSDTGDMCAVGRCMTRTALKKARTFERAQLNTSVMDLVAFMYKRVDDMLKPEYHGHELLFWTILQKLHDTSSNWTENGLSEMGKHYVKATLGITIP